MGDLRSDRSRRPNGASTIYQGKDGKWHGRVTVGVRDGSRPATAHQAHRTIRTALNEAMRRGHVTRNVASLARPPRIEQEEVEPYSIEEVRQILDVASQGRNGARWAIALALGLRQGEALGLRWEDLDLDHGELWVRRGRQRPSYEHGCGGTCGRQHAGFCPDKRTSVR
jgi:integrase